MHRRILLGLAATLTIYLTSMLTPIHAQATGCQNSFPADGHPGPWWTSTSGGTLHGNTAKVTCPDPSTHWDINYTVDAYELGAWHQLLNVHRSGNGSPSSSFSYSVGYLCDHGALIYRTHLHNNLTGGNMNKPTQSGTTLNC